MPYTSIISPQALLNELESQNLRVVDCRFSLNDPTRGRKDFEKSHIPGAVYAHLNDDLSAPVVPGVTGRHPLPEIEAAARVFSSWGIDETKQVVVYDDASGAIAARLWWLLKWLGHDAVAVLDGGWPNWLKTEKLISSAKVQPEKTTFFPTPRPEMIAEISLVENLRENENRLLVDAREEARFRGEVEPIDPIAGHIPGAVCAPFSGNLDENGFFKDKQELRDRFQKLLGERQAENAIVYCGSGVTACHNLLAMHHAELPGAKLYVGSWSEWITDQTRPVAFERHD